MKIKFGGHKVEKTNNINFLKSFGKKKSNTNFFKYK
jgi:hypothetical protein